jgi:hypothetical protein
MFELLLLKTLSAGQLLSGGGLFASGVISTYGVIYWIKKAEKKEIKEELDKKADDEIMKMEIKRLDEDKADKKSVETLIIEVEKYRSESEIKFDYIKETNSRIDDTLFEMNKNIKELFKK